jgi:hypothetical protein
MWAISAGAASPEGLGKQLLINNKVDTVFLSETLNKRS